jgi:hypothetical protein
MLVKNYKQLSYLSAVSNFLIVITLIAVCIDGLWINFTFKRSSEEALNWWDWKGVMLFSGRYVTALEGTPLIPGIYASARRKHSVTKLYIYIYATYFVVSNFSGVIGYTAHRAASRDVILMNLNYGIISTILKVVYMVSLLGSFIMMCFPILEVLENTDWFRPKPH